MHSCIISINYLNIKSIYLLLVPLITISNIINGSNSFRNTLLWDSLPFPWLWPVLPHPPLACKAYAATGPGSLVMSGWQDDSWGRLHCWEPRHDLAQSPYPSYHPYHSSPQRLCIGPDPYSPPSPYFSWLAHAEVKRPVCALRNLGNEERRWYDTGGTVWSTWGGQIRLSVNTIKFNRLQGVC